MTLTELANYFSTDKGTALPDWHGYTEIYNPWCVLKRGLPIKILEIGVHSGASLRMWAHYFQEAKVYGIDIALPKVVFQLEPRPFIHVEQIDQTDINALSDFAKGCGPFDLIVDDGSHDSDAHLLSLAALLPFLRPGGRYCIEDVLAEQPVMEMAIHGKMPAHWGGLTKDRARELEWTAHRSRYPGRWVVIGDKGI